MEATLLDAATVLLERDGPNKLSVRRIAAAAGVAPMGVYNHFGSKDGIIEALFVRGFERLAAVLTAAAQIPDPYQALRESGRHYRDAALAHPKMYQLMFLRAVPGFEPSACARDVADHAFNGFVALVRRAMTAGVLVDGPPRDTARMIWASVHGWMSLELLDMGEPVDHAATFDRMCRSLLAGLGTYVGEDAICSARSDELPQRPDVPIAR